MWTITLDGQVPGISLEARGKQIRRNRFNERRTGPLSIHVRGKHDGRLRGSLELAAASAATTRVRVRGDITVSVGIGGGTAAKLGRDQVLKPIFVEDMCPLLRDWPDPGEIP